MAQINNVNGFSFSALFQKAGEKINNVLDSLVDSMHLNEEDFYGEDEDYEEDEEESKFYDCDLVEVLLSDPPDKAYVAYNESSDKTIIKLYDDKGECYYSNRVDGNLQEEYNTLIYDYTTDEHINEEDIINISVVKGSGKPSQSRRNITKSIATMCPEAKEQLGRALVSMQNDANRERVYVKPIFPEGQKGKSFKTSYSLFEFTLVQLGSDFDIEPVFQNLNLSLGKDVFNDETVEEVLVGSGGTNIAFRTKDGLKAFLNFQNGARQITDANSKDGLELVLHDTNGPLMRR